METPECRETASTHRLGVGEFALSMGVVAQPLRLRDNEVWNGVLTDMSGRGSVLAVEMAIEDFKIATKSTFPIKLVLPCAALRHRHGVIAEREGTAGCAAATALTRVLPTKYDENFFFSERSLSHGQGDAPVQAAATDPNDVRPNLREAGDVVPLSWDNIDRYLSGQGMHISLAHAPRQFAGGLANLNYLVEIDGREYVLRRPPLGEVLPGANDMAREHRVLQALAPHFRYAPRAVLYCADPAVMGTHFQIMEYRAGRVVSGAQLPPDITDPNIGQHLAGSMVDLLAQLHSLDPAAVGLGDLGKPEGFLARAVAGWTRRAERASENQPNQVIRFISAWLEKNRTPELQPTLLHADFKLDNLILHPQTLEPVALLDWDMATRGDPLFDLATLLSYWTEPGDPPAMHDLAQMPTAGYGFPSRCEVVQAYASATGRDVSNLAFYRVLCLFKLSVVFMQLHARYRSGATTDPRYSRFGELSQGLLEFTHDLAQGRHA